MNVVEAVRSTAGEPPRKTSMTGEPAGAVTVRPDTIVVDAATGEPVAAHIDFPRPPEVEPLRGMLAGGGVTWTIGEGRLSGLRYEWASFGYRPRTPLRRQDFCSPAQLTVQFPATAAEIARVTPMIQQAFEAAMPGVYAAHRAAVADILPDWRIGGADGIWTSGVMNNTAALQYHTDSNNAPGSWSAMLTLRRAVRGGRLWVPAYNAVFDVPDRSLLIFPGAQLLHAVTPLRPARGIGDAYRWTLVWYANGSMRSCLPCREEQARARRVRTEREGRMAAGETLGRGVAKQ